MRPSTDDVASWYRDPKDNGVRYCGVNNWNERLDYFYLPDKPYDFDGPGEVTLFNYNSDDFEVLGRATSEANAITLMSEHFKAMNAAEDL